MSAPYRGERRGSISAGDRNHNSAAEAEIIRRAPAPSWIPGIAANGRGLVLTRTVAPDLWIDIWGTPTGRVCVQLVGPAGPIFRDERDSVLSAQRRGMAWAREAAREGAR